MLNKPDVSFEAVQTAKKLADKVLDDYENYNMNPKEAAFVAQVFLDLLETVESVIRDSNDRDERTVIH